MSGMTRAAIKDLSSLVLSQCWETKTASALWRTPMRSARASRFRNETSARLT